jgi:GNAT superfamily N-acetyltransferase
MIDIVDGSLEHIEPVVDLYIAARMAWNFMPFEHSPQSTLWYFKEHAFPHESFRLAYIEGELVGFASIAKCVAEPDWLERLYVHPEFWGRNIGRALIADAKRDRDALQLWCFAANERAKRFYEHEDFMVVEKTDGAHNQEKEPDWRYVWQRSVNDNPEKEFH